MNSTVVYVPSAEMSEIQHRRGVLPSVKRGMKWFGVGLVVLLSLGFAYQRVGMAIDGRNYGPRGQVYVVENRLMHIRCEGEGGPVVILEAGGAAESLWWYGCAAAC
ncbi:MAG: hypothetical protein IPK19_05475 [Chloroflexi bacterium]|nr:hypothetical protein [Chloroflexota bacterium]